MRLPALALLVLCLSATATAQPQGVRVPVTAAWVNAGGLGYRQGPEVGVGVEAQTAHVLGMTAATVGFRHKGETGDGHEIGLSGRICGRVREWLVCGGGRYDETVTSRWSKGAARPTVGIGWQRQRHGLYVRALVDYEVGAFDAANGLHGIDGDLRLGRPDLCWVVSVGAYRFHATGAPERLDRGWRLSSGVAVDPVAMRHAMR